LKVDRRKQQHPRIGPLLIRTKFRFSEKPCKGYVTNLSLGGAFLATEEKIPQGHSLQLTISLPWQLGQFDVEAKVIWRRPDVGPQGGQSPGMGVQFSNLDQDGHEKIEAYLKRFHQLAASLPDLVS
jgi:uncharacterized protein (TIGR02266 family)